MDGLQLLWSIEKRAWWRPHAMGYTTDVTQAGRFDADEATRRAHRGVPGVHEGSVAVPLQLVEIAARSAITPNDAREAALAAVTPDAMAARASTADAATAMVLETLARAIRKTAAPETVEHLLRDITGVLDGDRPPRNEPLDRFLAVLRDPDATRKR